MERVDDGLHSMFYGIRGSLRIVARLPQEYRASWISRLTVRDSKSSFRLRPTVRALCVPHRQLHTSPDRSFPLEGLSRTWQRGRLSPIKGLPAVS